MTDFLAARVQAIIVNTQAFDLALSTLADSLGVLLLWSGILKLLDRNQFRQILDGYAAVPRRATGVASHAVPVIELILGGTMLWPTSRPTAAIGSGAFFFAAAIVVGASLARGSIPERCGCFGFGTNERPTWVTVGRAAILAALALLLAGGGVKEVTVRNELIALALALTAGIAGWSLREVVANLRTASKERVEGTIPVSEL